MRRIGQVLAPNPIQQGLKLVLGNTGKSSASVLAPNPIQQGLKPNSKTTIANSGYVF